MPGQAGRSRDTGEYQSQIPPVVKIKILKITLHHDQSYFCFYNTALCKLITVVFADSSLCFLGEEHVGSVLTQCVSWLSHVWVLIKFKEYEIVCQ